VDTLWHASALNHAARVIVKRRHVLRLLGGAAAAWPLAVQAQQTGKIWRMGFIAHGHERFYDALFKGLQELGYVEG
jgi:putative ABC transport system substrate-binding protein